jgi:hypothetical protein
MRRTLGHPITGPPPSLGRLPRPASRRLGGLRKGRPLVVAVEHPGIAVPHPCGDGQRNCAIVISFRAEYASVAWKAGQRVGALTNWIENNEPSVRAGFLALRCFRCRLQRPADESGHRTGLAASLAQSDLHPGRRVRTARMRAFKRSVSGTLGISLNPGRIPYSLKS